MQTITKYYNKLVRDNIPDIIQAKGHRCATTTLSDESYLDLLDMKLYEELAEYQADKSQEELADMLEVMMSIVVARGYKWDDILAIQEKKRTERGGFSKKIVLLSVEENVEDDIFAD